MRTIDADAFCGFLREVSTRQHYEILLTNKDKYPTVADVIEAICCELDGTSLNGFDNAPTIEERPQGEWIEKVERRGCFVGDKTVYSYTCPFCGVKEFKKYPFCHCGADMRSVDEGLHERAVSDLSKTVDDLYKKLRGGTDD